MNGYDTTVPIRKQAWQHPTKTKKNKKMGKKNQQETDKGTETESNRREPLERTAWDLKQQQSNHGKKTILVDDHCNVMQQGGSQNNTHTSRITVQKNNIR